MKKRIAILGSTGSIGKSLIDIIKNDKKNFEIVLLSSNTNLNELIKQVKLFTVRNIVVTDYKSYIKAKKTFKKRNINIYNDFNNFKNIFKNKKVDYTMSSISGLDGLVPTTNIIKFSKTIAIANKETIICGWNLIQKEIKKYKVNFIPVDSEHFSIWSLLSMNNSSNIRKVYITASGGPFLNYNLNQFKKIKLKDALKHPNWTMGKKITIDSATMMNKVFEVIETNRIFKVDLKNISILSHEKSYLHAILEFKNGLIKFLAHDTDMKIPIFNSLYEGSSKEIQFKKLNILNMNNLNLKEIDYKKFPVIKLLQKYPKENSLFDTILISINDKLVKLFLQKKISFVDISKKIIKYSELREFQKFKKISPKNVAEISKLSEYVSLKIQSMCV
jgi:1-deoxy-D-xylulose-5-phosphate reductoisomerase